MSGFRVCGDTSDGPEFYYLGYNAMVDGYRHAYEREIPGSRIGRREVKLTRSAHHPPDPRCPGCVERNCPECGKSTHPSLAPCPHHPGYADYTARMDALYRKVGIKR